MKSKNLVNKSIKIKLLSVILPVLLITVIGLILISYLESKNIIEADAKKMLEISTISQSNDIKAWLDNNISYFNASKVVLENSISNEELLQNNLNSYHNDNPAFPNGFIVVSNNNELWKADGYINIDVENTSHWFNEGMKKVNMSYGDAYTNSEGELSITASGILKSEDDDVKILAADISLQRIRIIVTALINMDSAESVLVDLGSNKILSHQNEEYIMNNIYDLNDVNLSAIAERIKLKDFSFLETDTNLVEFSEISGTDWLIVSYVPKNSVYASVIKLKNFLMIIGIGFVIIVLLIIERFTNFIINPIKRLTDLIFTMSQGDFTVSVNSKGNDEISIMSQSIEEFINIMITMLHKINNISQELTYKAKNSSNISEQLSKSSNTQAESMKNLNATVDQLAQSINIIAEDASKLSYIVTDTTNKGNIVSIKMAETVNLSEVGQENMKVVDTAMSEIKISINSLSEAICKVGNASLEITGIIKVIGNIANETKLLALNASIEAARAGDAGKGFAVVANEIGKLAVTSSRSVKSISDLISDVKYLTDDAVLQAENSTYKIVNSSELIETAVTTFDSIYKSIYNTNAMVKGMITEIQNVDAVAINVASISEEQASSSEEILATSELMLLQANTIAKNSDVIANDANLLSDSALELEGQVKQFKID